MLVVESYELSEANYYEQTQKAQKEACEIRSFYYFFIYISSLIAIDFALTRCLAS